MGNGRPYQIGRSILSCKLNAWLERPAPATESIARQPTCQRPGPDLMLRNDNRPGTFVFRMLLFDHGLRPRVSGLGGPSVQAHDRRSDRRVAPGQSRRSRKGPRHGRRRRQSPGGRRQGAVDHRAGTGAVEGSEVVAVLSDDLLFAPENRRLDFFEVYSFHQPLGRLQIQAWLFNADKISI